MKWFYCSGIFLLYFVLVHGENKKDCLVKDHYKEQHWDGKEAIFFAYVKENDVVEIKINYNFIDEAKFFTILYISPSESHSKRIEKRDDIHHYFNLTSMKKADDWVEFKISLQSGTIEVAYGPNIIEQISVNQTSVVPKDLNVRSSFISLCRQEKEWKVYDETKTILLGRDALHKTLLLKFHSFHPHHGVKPGIRIFNSNETLHFNDYYLTIESTEVILKPMEDELNSIIIPTNKNVTTIDIFSESGKFTVSVLFDMKPPLGNKKECLNSSLPHMSMTMSKNVTNGDNCSTCYNNTYFVGFIITLSLLIVASIMIGILIKYKDTARIQQITRILTNNNKKEAPSNQQELEEIFSVAGTNGNNSSALPHNEEETETLNLSNGHQNGIPN